MEVLIVLAVLLAGGVVLAQFSGCFSGWEFVGGLTAFGSGLSLLVALLLIPVYRLSVESQIAEIAALQATASESRQAMDALEGATFRTQVADANRWIASTQFYNGTVWDIWIPDSIMSVEPVK